MNEKFYMVASHDKKSGKWGWMPGYLGVNKDGAIANARKDAERFTEYDFDEYVAFEIEDKEGVARFERENEFCD